MVQWCRGAASVMRWINSGVGGGGVETWSSVGVKTSSK